MFGFLFGFLVMGLFFECKSCFIQVGLNSSMFGVNLHCLFEAKRIALLYTGRSGTSHNAIFPLFHVVFLLRGRRGAKFHCLVCTGGKK